MFFHKVYPRDLLEHLKMNLTGLCALNIVALHLNMLLLYKNAASMPDFILAMEEVQKKAKCAELPILNIELAMYVATSILQSGNYKKETNEWEGRNAAMKTWSEWKQAYLAAYARGLNHQHADATDKLFSQAANLVMLQAAHDVMGTLAGLLDNLVLATTTNRTTVQQLMLAILLLTTLVATLTAAKQQKTHQNGGLLQPCTSGTWRRQRMWQQCPPWPQSNLWQLLLDAWVQGITYQQNLQCVWQETGTQ
jgi:hypothetical protein